MPGCASPREQVAKYLQSQTWLTHALGPVPWDLTADNSTNYKAKEYMPQLTLSQALTLLKLSITGAFFPGYIPGYSQLQDSVMSRALAEASSPRPALPAETSPSLSPGAAYELPLRLRCAGRQGP